MKVETVFVDSNVILRFFVGDAPVLARRAEALFQGAIDGRCRLVTSDLVVAEVIWVLESYYSLERGEIVPKIDVLMRMRNFEVGNAPVLRQALIDYQNRGVDFIDAYNVAYLRWLGVRKFATFDLADMRKFERDGLFEIV